MNIISEILNTKLNKPVYLWADFDTLEEQALIQIRNLAQHPKTIDHIAIMPDCHPGIGMPIGGVAMFEAGIYCPNAIGTDIGCGMALAESGTNSEKFSKQDLREIINTLKTLIPFGFNKHHINSEQYEENLGFAKDFVREYYPNIEGNPKEQKIKFISESLATLGGGNHFLELQRDFFFNLHAMLHTGSRNLGYEIAQRYHKIAIDFCKGIKDSDIKEYFEKYDPTYSLAFLTGDLAQQYKNEMDFAVEFAKLNRILIMQIATKTLNTKFKCSFEPMGYDVKHNYAESTYDFPGVLHRKGATSARQSQPVIIPGSMGTSSYFGYGKNNANSFYSCSHGAGRIMSRTQFSKTHSVEECDKAMGNVVFDRWNKNRKGIFDLSEAPGAYKNIEDVIKNELDLIDPVVKLFPIAVLKG